MQKKGVAAKQLVRSVLPERNAPHLKGGVSIFVESIIVLQVVLILLHFMIYETLVAAFNLGIHEWGLALALSVLSLTFMSASILATAFRGRLMRAYYKLAALWFAFVAPLCGACFGFVVTENLIPLRGPFMNQVVVGAIWFGAAFLITLYGLWNGSRAQITRVGISLPNLPKPWKGKRIVFVSDLHLGSLWGRRFAAKVARRIQACAPFGIFIGGDMFDGVKCDPEYLIAPFKDLRSPLGTYFVTGNHEYIRDSKLLLDVIRSVGIRILDNEKVDLRGVQLVGVDFNDTEHREEFATVLAALQIDPAKPSILLRHVPDNLDVAERFGISLDLSGHTHRGQFFPLSYVTRYFYKGFDYGLNKLRTMSVFTSSGVGTWMSPFRLGTKSEIVLIEFK